jgi:heme-degrading monooxygenase HmoA
MYVVINRYAGAANRTDAALPKVRAEFVPLLQSCDGFLGYATFSTEEGDVIACLFWEHGEAAASSRDKIRGWVRDNLEGFEEPTDRFAGTSVLHAVVAPQSRGTEQPFFCLVRTSIGIPTDGSQRLNAEEMRDAAKTMPGFRGMYFARSDADPIRGAAVLFCDTEEQAIAVHKATQAISARNQPKVELCVVAAGQTTIVAIS